jgi:hypothetical protein
MLFERDKKFTLKVAAVKRLITVAGITVSEASDELGYPLTILGSS